MKLLTQSSADCPAGIGTSRCPLAVEGCDYDWLVYPHRWTLRRLRWRGDARKRSGQDAVGPM